MATLQEVASDAFPVLVDTATNRSTITYGDLAARLFYLSAYRSLYCYFFTIDTSSIALIQGLEPAYFVDQRVAARVRFHNNLAGPYPLASIR